MDIVIKFNSCAIHDMVKWLFARPHGNGSLQNWHANCQTNRQITTNNARKNECKYIQQPQCPDRMRHK